MAVGVKAVRSSVVYASVLRVLGVFENSSGAESSAWDTFLKCR